METPPTFWLFEEPIEWTPGAKNGFLLTPHDNGAAGWGEPLKDDAGNPIVPGTLGGPNQGRVLGKKKGKYALKHSPNLQAAGCIDWLGPDPGEGKTRKMVTVNGPLSRYWNPGGKFQYDGNPLAHEIYQDGRILAVSPLPVLGACLSPGKFTHTSGLVEDVEWVIAVCKSDDGDVCLARPGGSLVRRDKLSEVRTAMSAWRSTGVYPKGWIVIGSLSRVTLNCEALPPEAPWFFDSDGLNGKTVRRATKTFNPGGTGGNVTHEVYFLIEMSITHTVAGPVATFNSIGYSTTPDVQGGESTSADGFTYKERAVKTHPTYVSPADGNGNTHLWQEDHLKMYVNFSGEMLMAADYDALNNRWVYGKLVVNHSRYYARYWTIGIDPPGYPNANTGNQAGPTYAMPSPYVAAEADHYPNAWIGVAEGTKFRVYHDGGTIMDFFVGYGQTGNKSIRDGLPYDGSDPYLAFYDSMDVYLHHVDLRYRLFAGFVHADVMEVNPYEWSPGQWIAAMFFTWEELEWAGKGLDDPFEESGESTRFSRFTSEWFWTSTGAVGWGENYVEGWQDHTGSMTVREIMESWPTTFDTTMTRTSHDGSWSMDNTNGAVHQPWHADFFWGESAFRKNVTPTGGQVFTPWTLQKPAWIRRSITELFTDSSKCYRPGVIGSLPTGESLVYFVYSDLKWSLANSFTYEEKVATRLWPTGDGDVPTLVPFGNRYEPGGVL